MKQRTLGFFHDLLAPFLADAAVSPVPLPVSAFLFPLNSCSSCGDSDLKAAPPWLSRSVLCCCSACASRADDSTGGAFEASPLPEASPGAAPSGSLSCRLKKRGALTCSTVSLLLSPSRFMMAFSLVRPLSVRWTLLCPQIFSSYEELAVDCSALPLLQTRGNDGSRKRSTNRLGGDGWVTSSCSESLRRRLGEKLRGRQFVNVCAGQK
jgi:hypothetical protein